MQRFASLFAATALVAAIVAGYLFVQLRAEHLRSAQLRERIVQLEVAQRAALASAPIEPSGPRGRPMHDLPVAPEGSEAASVPAQGGTPVAEARPNASRMNNRDLMKDPDFRAAQLAQRRMQLQRNYADLAKELSLSPAQVDALFDLMARQQLARMSEPGVIAANAQSANDEASRSALRNAMEESRRAQEAEIATLLGDAKFREFKEYQDTMGARQRVTQLRSQLAMQGQLLAEEQVKPMITAMAAEQKLVSQQMAERERPQRGDATAQIAYREAALKITEESNRRLLRAASSHLDAKQLESLEALLEQDATMSRTNLRLQRARMDAQGRSEDQ
jgi:hypothetical protein